MIKENLAKILQELPQGIQLVGAAKTRAPEELKEAIDAGLSILGENYVQEAENAFEVIGKSVKWHLIGHLQSNKTKRAVAIFDMIETVDSEKLARAIDRECEKFQKFMEILIQINSGEEKQKAGIMPDKAVSLIRKIAVLENIRVMGLMTMGAFTEDLEILRSCFQITRKLFEKIKCLNIPGIEMQYLSMGMSDSYKVAIEEGANLVRIGTGIFGPRKYR